MPAGTQGNGRSRFELPALAPLDSLTKGTDIPPPPDSPIEEKAPVARPKEIEPAHISAVAEGAPLDESAGNGHTNGINGATGSSDTYSGGGRTSVASVPLSPVSITRPSSIRKFLSRKSLYSSYTNGANDNRSQENLRSGSITRPESSLNLSIRPEAWRKRSSSWIRKLANGQLTIEPEAKRTSVVYEEKMEPQGPPAPKLPELNQLKAKVHADREGSLGAEEMFKNIK